MITLAQVKAADKISAHPFHLLEEDAALHIYEEIMRAHGELIKQHDMTLAQAYDCMVALETGKHCGYSTEFPAFIAAAYCSETGHTRPELIK